MKYIFLSLLFNKEHETDYLNKIGFLPMSLQNFQSYLVGGFRDNSIKDFMIINTLPFPSFPRFGGAKIKSDNFDLCGYNCETIEYLNFPVIKNFSKQSSVVKTLLKRIDPNECNCIIVYSLYIPYLKACLKIKKLYPNTKIHVIIPDLPYPYSPKPKSAVVRVWDALYERKSIKIAKRFDSFTFLTSDMIPVFDAEDKKYCVVEGIYGGFQPVNNILKSDKIVFLYSGTLRKWSGIIEFIEAFSKIDNDRLELWVFGKGECSEQIEKMANIDFRIKYYGFVENAILLEKMQASSFLINPRKNFGEYVKYSFPSKTMEYLSTGIPILMYKLEGIPQEYDEYLNYFGDNLEESLRNVLSMNYEKLIEKANKGKEFLLIKKTPKPQVEKIIKTIGGN